MKACVSVSRVCVLKEAADVEEAEAAIDLSWRNGVVILRNGMVFLGLSLRDFMDDG